MTDPGTDRHALLAVPARAQIVALVRASDEPLTAQQLADALDLHVTTVRFHLDLLAGAGLVVGAPTSPHGRGRPRIGYRAGSIDVADVREQMIDALAEALADRGSRDRSLAAGRRWAERLPEPAGPPTDAIVEVFTRLGFDPEPGADAIWLHECPFGDSARRSPDVVCRVHLGLAQGLARRAAAAQGTTVPAVDLVPFARPDACALTLTEKPVR